MSLTIILVEKNATLKTLTVKDFKESELFTKCGFKKSEDFQKQTKWTCNGYEVSVYGKKNGRANNENKYDFPPPIDSIVFFGTCCIVAKKHEKMENLTLELWEKIYEKLFGGFDDLSLTALADEEEQDELEFVSNSFIFNSLSTSSSISASISEESSTTDDSNHSNSELSEESYEE